MCIGKEVKKRSESTKTINTRSNITFEQKVKVFATKHFSHVHLSRKKIILYPAVALSLS